MASVRLQSRASCASLIWSAGLYGRALTSCPCRCPCPGPRAFCWTWRPWEAVSSINSLALEFPLSIRNYRRFVTCGNDSVALLVAIARTAKKIAKELSIWQLLVSLLLLKYLYQMRDLGHHSTNGGRIFPLNHLVQPGKTKPFDYQLVLHRRADFRAHVLKLNCLLLCCHAYNSCSALPRRVATSCR